MKTIFMPQKLFTAWVADLRANPHLQGYGTMRTPGGTFCCLGRLQMVADGRTEPMNVPTTRWRRAHKVVFTNTDGMICDSPTLSNYRTAVGCNDDLKLSFPQIAGLLEQAYGGEWVPANAATDNQEM